ncbi:PTS galactitol transporter subunit IIC [Corticicoccus populi]|uniref:PTS galactitol transporter subunit IIC n=1 Tax=Corticicoccus populi TaxID=1812821 RepID=A0ABW5WTD5_9STAP
MGDVIVDAFQYILSFGPEVMLPIIIFIMAVAFRVSLSKALKSALTIGFGFVGIFLVLDLLTGSLGPAIEAMIDNSGVNLPVMDTGWPPLAAIAFASPIAPVVIILTIIINIVMLVFKWTKTVDVDLWNYWHFAFAGSLVYIATGNFFFGLIGAAIATIITFKLADWSAPYIHKRMGLPGISLPTLSSVIYFPVGILGDKIINLIPGLNKLNADPESIKKRFGVLGEPMMIGVILGVIIGIIARFEIRNIIELGISLGAVMFIMPRMVKILMEGLIPLSDAIRSFLQKRFPDRKDLNIGLDIAVIIGNPAVVSTALLLVPVTILLAVVLPGVIIMPLGDLPFIVVPLAMVLVATNKNIIRSAIIGIPMIIVSLYLASNLAPLVTNVAESIQYEFPEGATSMINSFLDGGNPVRYWLVMLAQGNWIAVAIIPVVLIIVWYIYRLSRRDFDENGQLKE